MSEAEGTTPTPEEAPQPAAAPQADAGQESLDPEVALAEDAATGDDLEAQLAASRDQHLRAVAELDNVRKRARRDTAAAEAKGIGRLVRELLPALDNLDRALAAVEQQDGDEEHELTKGIRLVQQELLGALARVGVETDAPKGEPFDPHRHEAIAQHPVEGTGPGVIVDVYQVGYHLQDTVLRAAKVVVSA